MKRLKLFFACLLMAVLSIGQVWATNAPTTFANKTTGTWSDNVDPLPCATGGLAWAASATPNQWEGGTNDRGIQWTNSSIKNTSFTITNTSLASNTISSVSIVASTNSNANLVHINVTVGSTDFGTQNMPKANDQTFTFPSSGTKSASGNIVVTISGDNNSNTKSFYLKSITVTYSSGGQQTVATPTFSVAEGTYHVAQSVTISCGTSDASIYYTTNGSTPSTSSTPYDGAISLNTNGTTTIRAIAAKSGMTTSSEASATYTIALPRTVTLDAEGGTCTETSVDEEAATYGTITLPVASPSTDCDNEDWTFAGWATATCTETTSAPTLYQAGSYNPANGLELHAVYKKVVGGSGSSEETAETTIGDYANDNSWEAEHKYTSLALDDKITLTASTGTNTGKYYDTGDVYEWRFYSTESATITISAASGCTLKSITPTFNVKSSGVLKDGDNTLSSGESYSISGTSKTLSIEVGQVKFTAISVTYETSGGGTMTYNSNPVCSAPSQCVKPTFNPGQGTFNAAQSVTLSTTTAEADIYYTLDGETTPSKTSGTKYNGTPISVTQNTTIKAIAIKDAMDPSEVATGVFNIRYAQPTFSVASGDYDEAQNVTITATGADAIYYTTNGEDPIVDPANLYDGSAIAINTTGSHTIKAIAVKAGYANSNVASATYVMDLPYATIADFIASGTGSTVKRLQLTNAYILGVNGYSIYVQDASAKGIIIYNKYGYGSAEWVANLVAGNQITGVVSGTNTLYNQQPELASAAFVTPTITAGTRPTPANITAINEAAFTENTMKLVKVSGVYYQESPSNKNYTFTADEDGLATAQKVYDQFGMIADHTMVEVGDQCDLIGIMARYNANYQLLPVLVTDIAADADAAAPVFTPEGGATEGEALQVDLNSYVTIAAADAKHSVDVDQVQITSTDPVSVTAVSSRDFYRSTSVTKWYYGNAATASYDITIEGVTTQGTVVAQVNSVDAASAAEGDEVHILITPNTHFELATITVNGNDPDVVSAGTEYSFEMPAAAVTIAVTWNEDAKATLTFAKGEATGTEDAPTAITDYVGETVQLPANPFTYNGYKFIGWSCDGGTTKLAAGADYELAENKAFVAYWAAIPTFNDADHEWRLATSLEAGKYYVIGSASQDKTASKTITSGYMSEIDSEIEDGVIAYNALGANTAIFLLGGNSTDGWTLTEVTTDDVLGTTANKNVSWNAGTQFWAISIAEGGNATIGGTSRILHNAANTGKRFTTYTSDLTASMLLPQLYVWTEKAFKLRYDANGGTNAPTATLAVAGKATVTDERPTAPAGKIFDGWNENATGIGEDYVAGDEIAITTADVTIYAKWRDPNTYTISYNANGGTLMEGKSVIAPEDVTEGEEYSVKANVYEKEGKIFTGWQYGANIYNANDELLPTEDIEFIAQWSDPNITDYVLVTNINQLKNGDKVYIVAAATGNAMGAQYSTTYRQRVEIEKTADKSHVITTGTEPVELTLGTTDGSYYTFNDGTGYLYANSTSANNIGTQEDLTNAGKWTITIDAEGNTTIVSQGETQYNKLTYNAAQPRFAAYKNAQQAVVLYKKLETIREDGVAPGVWGTICPKNEIVNAEGASFFQISYVEYHSGVPYKVFYDEIAEGENLVAGQPYLFLADENATAIKGFKVGNDATSATNDHGFIGVLSDKLITVEAADVTAYRYYIVYDNEIRLCGEGQFRIKAERAYLDMSDPNVEKQYKAPIAGRRRVALTNNAVQNATGCENINASETPVKMIINGQMYILRGEKMYDATGKLVK
jgi:hypothetical protein